MAEQGLQRSGGERRVTPAEARQTALRRIDEQFQVGTSVKTLQNLMKDVTAKELNAETVNAACNCVNQINSTLKTTIAAAKFLAET